MLIELCEEFQEGACGGVSGRSVWTMGRVLETLLLRCQTCLNLTVEKMLELFGLEGTGAKFRNEQ